jgi:hypothetical protein
VSGQVSWAGCAKQNCENKTLVPPFSKHMLKYTVDTEGPIPGFLSRAAGFVFLFQLFSEINRFADLFQKRLGRMDRFFLPRLQTHRMLESFHSFHVTFSSGTALK